MPASAERINLALLACAGLTDADLKERGPSAFLKMILRKRAYAKAARGLALEREQLLAKNAKLAAQVAELQAKCSALIEQQQDAPVSSTQTADAVLSLFTLGQQSPKTE